MERALQDAPHEIREVGEFVLDFVAKPNGIADEAVRAVGKIANYLETPDGRFIAVLKKEVADAQKHKRWDTSPTMSCYPFKGNAKMNLVS